MQTNTRNPSMNPLDTLSANHFVQKILTTAIEKNASDIHFETRAHEMTIRFRMDGMLHQAFEAPKKMAGAIISHIKIKANLDIAEKRLPQDGRYNFTTAHKELYTCRVSTLPTLNGEKLVIRLLRAHAAALNLDQLGFTKAQAKIFKTNIQKPQGLILITGATGSGKTTTLYAALSALNHAEKNITTIEDPIEIELANINQTNVNPKIGFDFHQALRALLRQDPDIIMVGEIRDSETASMAVHAAQTGHLVLATLHTNSALESLTRLSLMGILTIDLVETLNLIVAQRLVRKLCNYCKTHKDSQTGYQASGCDHCTLGFKGRIGVYQFFELNTQIKQLLLQGKPPHQIAQEIKITTLWDEGLKKVVEGLTTRHELQRTVGYNPQ